MDHDYAEYDFENDDYVIKRPLLGCGDLLMTSWETASTPVHSRNKETVSCTSKDSTLLQPVSLLSK